jgi:hypothetical protein
MTAKHAAAAIVATAIAGATSIAWAWEAPTTHAGLAEQAAQSSALHRRLVMLGFSQGLYESLTIPPKDAPTLIAALSRMSPSQGYVPDARGRQFAIAWLAAGAAVADQPPAHAANHFLDVDTGEGLIRPDIGIVERARSLVFARLGRGDLPAKGMPASEWITSKENPLGLDGFLDQYAKAVRGQTPGERGRAMAGALVAAGAMMHVLGDLGAPSRVRGDGAAHLERLGAGPDDLGSRFEHVAALAYGRLGVPAPGRVVTRTRLADFFRADLRGVAANEVRPPGLADWVATHFFSPGTLPEDTRVGSGGTVTPKLARSSPALPGKLNLMAATQEGGTTLKDEHGMCLARYEVEHGVLRFDLDDECLLEQIAVILPEVAAFETGLLEYLFRGELAVTFANNRVQVAARTLALGAGEVEIFAEDARGVRTSVSKAAVTKADDGAALGAAVTAPAGSNRLIAVFTGVDLHGERVVAVGAASTAK